MLDCSELRSESREIRVQSNQEPLSLVQGFLDQSNYFHLVVC